MSLSLKRALPNEMGVAPEKIIKVLDEIEKNQIGVHGIMVMRHNNVIAEGWYKPYRPDYTHVLFSLSKSFTSSAIGLAIDEGLISLDDKIYTFFEDLLPFGACENIYKITIRNLLTMASGHSEIPMLICDPQEEDMRYKFMTSYVDLEPGSKFVYNTPATYMLSAIISKVTGQNVFDYLTPRLFEPMGIENIRWETDKNGISLGGIGLNLKTEDIAKFGTMLLNKGVFEGRRILPEWWVNEATAKQIENENFAPDWYQGYGYQFWRCQPEDSFRADGAWGQYCLVLPREDMVIAINGGMPEMQTLLTIIWDNLITDLSDIPLEFDEGKQRELEERLNSLKIQTPEGLKISGIAKQYSGVKYELSDNEAGVTHIKFDFGEVNSVTFYRGEESFTAKIGYGDFIESDTFVKAEDAKSYSSFFFEKTACVGAWSCGIHHLTMAYNTTPFIDNFDVQFSDKGIYIEHTRNTVGKKSKIYGR